MLKQLSSKLENLFDHDANISLALEASVIEAQKQFTPTENTAHLQNLSYIYNSEVNTANIQSLFTQLACYFEMNFLLIRADTKQKHKTIHATLFGKEINNTDSWPAVNLPDISLFTVYKTPAQSFLKKFHLNELDTDKKMFAYLLALTPNCTLILVSKQAEPWSKIRIETLQQTLMKINFNL